MANLSPPPAQTVLCEPSVDPRTQGLYISATWYRWLVSLIQQASNVAIVKATVNLTGQSAAITTTAALAALPAAGLFRLTWLLQVTTPALTSSAAQVMLTWSSGGNTVTKTGINVNGNTLSTYETNTILIAADGLTDIDYAVSYASNLANTMKYRFALLIEQVA